MPTDSNIFLLSLFLLVGSSKATTPETLARINQKFRTEGAAVEPFEYEEALDQVAGLYLGVSKLFPKEPDFGNAANIMYIVLSKDYSKGAADFRAGPSATPRTVQLTARMVVDVAIRRLLQTTEDAHNYILNFVEENCTDFLPDAKAGRTHFGFAVSNNEEELRVVLLLANATYSFKEVLSKLTPPPDLSLDKNVRLA